MNIEATAFAPASVGNIGVGFDILGHTIAGPGDRATVRRIVTRKVRIATIHRSTVELPLEPERNTAGAALIAMLDALKPAFGFEIELDKGIAFGSGMGGSAASCVAALVAANALLDEPLSVEALYPFALAGEAAASGGHHGDNVGPMLLGGVVLATHDRLVRVPVPMHWYCVLVHPDTALETRHAREALQGGYALTDFISQSANLALVLSGCHFSDPDLVRAGLRDVLIEPRRAPLIPGFFRVKQAALDHGALGASISGAGPSVFAWFESEVAAEARRSRPCAPASPMPDWPARVSSRRSTGPRRAWCDEVPSARAAANAMSRLSAAIAAGLAADGGLYVPDALPRFEARDFDEALRLCPPSPQRLLAPFFSGDALAAIWTPSAWTPSRSRRRCGRWPRRTTICSSCSMARPRRSRISARASSPPACGGMPRDSRAAADDPRRHLGRYRCSRRCGVSPACRVSAS